jgi:hypothetical protein
MKEKKARMLHVLLAAAILTLAGCSKKGTDTSGLYVPTSSDATANATLQELQQGRALYVDNCGKCHGFYNPDGFSSSQWSSVLSSMAPKTSMTSGEIVLVTKYVTRGH